MKDVVGSDVQQFGNIWSQCVARAWQDAQFREALKRDPSGTLLTSFQFTLPEGVSLQVVESDEVVQAAQSSTLRMVIPPAPAMDLQQIAMVEAGPATADFCVC